LGFAVCVFEVHVVDTPWKLWLELRIMMMESLKTVGWIEAVLLCLHQSKFLTQLYTSLFGYMFNCSFIEFSVSYLDMQVFKVFEFDSFDDNKSRWNEFAKEP